MLENGQIQEKIRNANVPSDRTDVSEVAERHEVVDDEGAVLVLFGCQVLLDQMNILILFY